MSRTKSRAVNVVSFLRHTRVGNFSGSEVSRELQSKLEVI